MYEIIKNSIEKAYNAYASSSDLPLTRFLSTGYWCSSRTPKLYRSKIHGYIKYKNFIQNLHNAVNTSYEIRDIFNMSIIYTYIYKYNVYKLYTYIHIVEWFEICIIPDKLGWWEGTNFICFNL